MLCPLAKAGLVQRVGTVRTERYVLNDHPLLHLPIVREGGQVLLLCGFIAISRLAFDNVNAGDATGVIFDDHDRKPLKVRQHTPFFFTGGG